MRTELFYIFMVALLFNVSAFAASTLKLEGDYRVVNIYTNNEIPVYLRSTHCNAYAYEQRFEDVAFVKGKNISYPVPAGALQSDLDLFRARGICLLRLREESMIKGARRPVTLYEIDMFGAAPNELRAGENHRPMRDGRYVLESGTRIEVKDNRAHMN